MRRLLLACLALILVACGTPAPAAGQIQAVLAASELVVGPNRLPIGLIVDGSSTNEPQAKVQLKFYYLDGTEAQKTEVQGTTDATYFGEHLPAGVYVAYPTLPAAGRWGIEVLATLPDGRTGTSSLLVAVKPAATTPALGSAAIAVDTPTVALPLEQISSAGKPNPALYQLSITDALAAHKPLAVLFATPGFCKTAVCGPSVDVLSQMQKTYGDRMSFIHVEVYAYPFSESFQASPPKLSAGMQAWGLQSEPWLFLIDSQGTIRAKYEGGITTEEIGPVLDELLKDSAQGQ